jgi:hypothetical protein
MSTNPLKSKTEAATVKRTPQEWCDYGNAYLRGQRPAENAKPPLLGTYIDQPRHDVHWVVRNGQAVIEFCCPSTGTLGR